MLRSINMKGHFGRLRHLWLLPVMLFIGLSLSARTVRIYVTDHAGDTVYVIDPQSDKVVQVIEGIEVAHDVHFSPDGRRVYISVESENVLDVVDQKSGKIIKKVPLSGRPNTIAVSKDGGRVFVAIREPEPGGMDVIDTTSLERVKSIPTKGGFHDIYLTPDGKYLVAGSVSAKLLTVFDAQTEQPVWELNFDAGVRTMAFESRPDGSTHRIFVNVTSFNGFEVVDFAERKVVGKIAFPDEPSGGRVRGLSHDPAHGIGVAPDGKTLWANSKYADAVFVYSLPGLKLVGHVPIGTIPEWLTFTPDGKKVYISNRGTYSVSVIDAKALKMVASIPCGETPARNATLVLP
jgi:YVTN family beta-propeller protein